MMPIDNPKQFLLDLYSSAISAVSAEKCLPQYLPKPVPGGRTIVIGAGKGAAAMAKAVEDHWDGELSGLVVTRYEHGLPASILKWSRHLILCRMQPVGTQPNVCWKWLRG